MDRFFFETLIWDRFFFVSYINMLISPKIPNKIKIILDNISILEVENLEHNHFPKKMAIELLPTIPHTEPQTRGILNNGYSKPSPIDAKNVLSPSSPIAMLEATMKIQFFVKELKNFIIIDFESVFVESFTEPDFLRFMKPIIPKSKNVQ